MTMFLGLDLSTQGLKATLLDGELQVAAEVGVNFETDLPHYGTVGGVRFRAEDSAASSPTLMFVEAVDLLMRRFLDRGAPLGSVGAISVSGQQHGSVYWAHGAREVLASLDPERPLLPQMGDCFAVAESPIWMDASTAKYCEQLELAAGGPEALAAETGSKAFRRFTGSQIAKIRDTQPESYENVERINLISAFLTGVLLQDYAPEDVSDGSGMNLMQLRSDPPAWSPKMLDLVAGVEHPGEPDLANKLCAAPTVSYAVLGGVGEYFQQRFSFPGSCVVVAGAGDNPCSAAGMLLREDHDLCISLGSSDTAFMLSHTATPQPDVGSVYRSPLDRLSYMPLVVYTNGSLNRERVRDFGGGGTKDWAGFEALVASRPKANDGVVGFHLSFAEIVPQTDRAMFVHFDKDLNVIDEVSVSHATRCRGALEMRALAIRYHTTRLGLPRPERVILTGGAAQSASMSQILADVLQCAVYTSAAANSASMGAAFRAFHGLACSRGDFIQFTNTIATKLSIDAQLSLRAEPDTAAASAYHDLYDQYSRCEALLLNLPRP